MPRVTVAPWLPAFFLVFISPQTAPSPALPVPLYGLCTDSSVVSSEVSSRVFVYPIPVLSPLSVHTDDAPCAPPLCLLSVCYTDFFMLATCTGTDSETHVNVRYSKLGTGDMAWCKISQRSFFSCSHSGGRRGRTRCGERMLSGQSTFVGVGGREQTL